MPIIKLIRHPTIWVLVLSVIFLTTQYNSFKAQKSDFEDFQRANKEQHEKFEKKIDELILDVQTLKTRMEERERDHGQARPFN
jgi:hypothetical protein